MFPPTTSRSGSGGFAHSDEARVDVNFARMSLANSNPAEAVRIIARLDLDDLDNLTANEAASVTRTA